jgi:Flp pilus assembly pilin Flp
MYPMKRMQRFINEDSGQDSMEYGLLAALLSIVAITVLQNIGPLLAGFWNSIHAAIPGAGE